MEVSPVTVSPRSLETGRRVRVTTNVVSRLPPHEFPHSPSLPITLSIAASRFNLGLINS